MFDGSQDEKHGEVPHRGPGSGHAAAASDVDAAAADVPSVRQPSAMSGGVHMRTRFSGAVSREVENSPTRELESN